MKNWYVLAFIFLTALLLSACGNGGEESAPTENEENSTTEEENTETSETNTESITVNLKDRDENDVGTAKLQQEGESVTIKISASDLPEGTHGFHIHEKGSCEAPDFKSAGGHFNPTDASHGTNSEDGPHAGDLPNIDVSEDGTVEEEVTADMVTLKKGQDHSLLGSEGTSLVIHAKADDKESQPSGDAGDRIACGVISK